MFYTRLAAAIVACFAVSFSTVLALRYEYTISEANRNYIAEMQGLGLIAYHPETPGFVSGEHPNFYYSGLVPVNSAGYGDPKKAFWTLVPMLEQYADAVVGSECRFTQDGQVELLQGEHVSGVKPADQVVIVGTEKGLEQICATPG